MNQTEKRILLKDREIILLGTAHVSKESIADVERLIHEETPDCVCVELDAERYKALTQTEKWQTLDIVKVLKEGKGFLLLANLVLSAFQKKIGADIGVKPGDEMRAAIRVAGELSIATEMVDRPIHVTLKRAWAKNNIWGKAKLLATLFGGAFSDEKLTEKEIEALKDLSAMDSMMNEMAEYLPTVKSVLIDERDRYLASKIWDSSGKKIVAVLGAGHLPGCEKFLYELKEGSKTSDVEDIASVPLKSMGSKIAGWILPALLIGLIVGGFFKGGAVTSVELLIRWFLWNGSLAALGTLVALGHPLSILVGFISAPFATINPFIGVGLFTGLTQAWIKKPQVKDMENITTDVTSVKGWYKNKIAHVLLIFILSSIGGAIGNFIAIPALITGLLK